MQIDTKKVATVKGLTTKAEKAVAGFKITDQATYDKAGEKFIELKKLEKEFKAEERSWLDPINELRNKVFSYTRPARQKIEAALKTISAAMDDYDRMVETQRQADAAKLEDKVKAGDMTLAEATDQAGKLATVDSVQSDKGKMHTRTKFSLVVEDASKVPDEFKVVDMQAVSAYYTANGIVPAGIKIEQTQVRVARTV